MSNTELAPVKINDDQIPVVFKEKGLDPFINKIKEEANGIVADVSTAKGRQELKSLAYKIRQSKTYLDGVGKDYVARLKAIPKVVDAERKRMRDELDELADKVRLPLTEWENAEKARIEAEKLAKEIDEAWSLAIEENKLFDRQKEIERKEAEIAAAEEARRAKEEAALVEQERKDREAKIAAEAAENAKKEAEEKAAREKAEADRKAAEAKAAEEQAKREKEEALKAAEERRVRELKEAEERAKAEAEQREKDRLEKERLQKEHEQRLAANKKHRAKINNEILSKLIALGAGETLGRDIISAAAKGEIPGLVVSY